MASESASIVTRRFTGRLAESALLILAVALGVGAASAGFALFGNALQSGNRMLASPAYRELVASARSSAEEMAVPAARKPATSNVALTGADLDAATLVPSITHAYVENRDDLMFLNAASVKREAAMFATMPAGAPAGQGGPPGFKQTTDEDIAKAKAEADIVIVDGLERLNGFRVTPAFFEAWAMKAASGSLLTERDATGSAKAVVLGSAAATKVAGAGLKPADLVGRKLLTREGYMEVVGILAPTGAANHDEAFFASYKVYSSADSGGGPPRMWAMNTQLRFSVAEVSMLGESEKLLSNWFDSRFGEGQIVISNPREEARKLMDRNSGIGLLILFLALAGLFIALVNVSHILMSRGLRMRRNVGVMMALGASRSSILRLFAGEATFVSAAGSLLGGLLALPLSNSMQAALGISGGSWIFVAIGIAISWFLTLAFSVAPAWRNSRNVPAEAMRAA